MTRIRTGLPALLALLLAAQPVWAQDEEPLSLDPHRAWGVDYAEESCSLFRSFGSGEDPVHLEIRNFSHDGALFITVATKRFNARDRETDAWFLPRNILPDAIPSHTLDYGDGLEGVEFTVSAAARSEAGGDSDTNAESGVTALYIGNTFAEDFVLNTGEMSAPLSALRSCMDNLLEYWGLDPAIQRDLSRSPTPIDWDRTLGRVIQRMMPVVPLNDRIRATSVRYRLMIDEAGSIEDCHIQELVGSENFAEEMCEYLLRYGQFEPALDAAGIPVASYWVGGVNLFRDR